MYFIGNKNFVANNDVILMRVGCGDLAKKYTKQSV